MSWKVRVCVSYDRAAMLGNCYNDDCEDFVFVFICSDRCTTTASFAWEVCSKIIHAIGNGPAFR